MLALEDLRFAYDGFALRLDLRVARGVCCAIIGPSGSGKTTVLNLIAGFERPQAGRVVINGVEVTALPPARRPVTMLFQDHNLFAHLSAAANVGLGIHPGLRLGRTGWARVEDALERVGLEGMGDRLPGLLSGGERQRVAIARSLVRDKPVLLLDEPFAALGPALRFEMLDLVDQLRRQRGLTVVLVSHLVEDARRIAERTAVLDAGTIVAEGPTEALLAHPPPALRAYLGT